MAQTPATQPSPPRKDDGDQAVPLSRYWLFFAVALGGALIDLGTKYLIFGWRGLATVTTGRQVFWLLENYVGIETTVNHGALFGLGQGFVPLFALLSVVAGCGIVYWLFIRKAAVDWRLTLMLAFIMAGVFGNLYDRLGLWNPPPGFVDDLRYGVRDWILFEFQGHRWPNFNLADSFLVCGAISIVVYHLFQREEEPEAAKEAA